MSNRVGTPRLPLCRERSRFACGADLEGTPEHKVTGGVRIAVSGSQGEIVDGPRPDSGQREQITGKGRRRGIEAVGYRSGQDQQGVRPRPCGADRRTQIFRREGSDPLRCRRAPQSTWRVVAERRDEPPRESGCCRDTHLLPEDRLHGRGEPVGTAEHPQAWPGSHQWSKDRIGGKRGVDDGGVGVEVEPTAHRRFDICDVGPARRIDPRHHAAGIGAECHGRARNTVRGAQRNTVRSGGYIVTFVPRNRMAPHGGEQWTHRKWERHREPGDSDDAAASSRSRICLASTPPAYCPSPPSVRTTR